MLRRYLMTVAALGMLAPAVSANQVTISAVASLTGRAHFQSDVRVFNRSFDTPIHITATYYCSTSPCGNSPQSFDLAPRQSMAFDDIAANLFQAPGTQGAVTFQTDPDELVATSRLYSVANSGDLTGGSLGQFVPGLEDEDAYPRSILTSLRNSSDSHTGFRSNITAFNTSDSATAHVTFSLFNTTGVSLGSFSTTIAPHGFQPAFSIFGVTGSSATDTENAYCAVSSDQPVFVAASILDNISQDTIFVTGSQDDSGNSTQPPSAAFTFAPESPTAGQAVNFTDTSTGTPTAWSWDFGDQSAADTTQNPTHIYALPGTFSVTLTASNAGGPAEHTEQVVVAPSGSAPVANFSFAPNAPSAGQTVNFTDSSNGSPTSWSWNFGDPSSGSNTSTLKNPSHSYAASGDYAVMLTASNSSGPSSPVQKTVHVGSAGSPPTAKFTFLPANPSPSTSVSFTDTSTGSPTSWAWDFGDPGSGSSNSSTSQNPSHTFSGTGSFTVKLTASNGFGPSAPAQKTVTVGVPPTANFTSAPPSPTAGAAVVFTDTSTGSPTSWTWNFGDPTSGSSNTSTSKNPSHTFANASTYTVSLIATNAFGSSAPKLIDVTVGPAAVATILVVNVQEFGYNNCNPIMVHQGVTYKIQFHALDNGQPPAAGHGFSGVPSLGLSEHHNISTAADYTTEAFTPSALGTFGFHCTANPKCGTKSGELCAGGHSTMTGSIQVVP